MKVFVVYGFDLGSHQLVGVSKSEKGANDLKYSYEQSHDLPFVIIREIELID